MLLLPTLSTLNLEEILKIFFRTTKRLARLRTRLLARPMKKKCRHKSRRLSLASGTVSEKLESFQAMTTKVRAVTTKSNLILAKMRHTVSSSATESAASRRAGAGGEELPAD